MKQFKMKEKIEKLKKLGFKRKWASDRSCYWWQLEIKSKYLNKAHISVSFEEWMNPDESLSVCCFEPVKMRHRSPYVCYLYKGKIDFKAISHFIKILK